MTVGGNTVNLVNKMLDGVRNVAWQNAQTWVQLHVGDPGDDGLSNISQVTTRSQVTFNAAAGGAISLTGSAPSFDMTATETITHISVWTAAVGGSPLWSSLLGVAKSVDNNDQLTITACGLAIGPLMAD